jgi:hypothetical protein
MSAHKGGAGSAVGFVDHPDAEYDHFPLPYTLGGKTVV